MSNDYPIPSGAPAAYHLGTDDQSGAIIPRIPLAVPQHCPQVFLKCQTGPEDEQLAVGVSLLNTYGTETFNPRGEFYNHQTLLAQGFNAKGNLMSVKRIVPDNAEYSYITLYIDLLAKDIPQYERDADTHKVLFSPSGVPTPLVPAETEPGYVAKWVANGTKGAATGPTDIFYIDGNPALVGNQTDGATVSQRWPIMTLRHSFKTKVGDLVALRMWAQTLDNSTRMPEDMMKKYKAYPFFMSLLKKAEETSTATIKGTLVGSKQITVTLKDDVYDPVSDIAMFAGEAFVDRYQSIDDPRYPHQYGDIGIAKVYTKNIDTVTKLLIAKEVAAGVLPNCDFTSANAADAQNHLFNFVGGTMSNGAQYKTFIWATGAGNTDAISMNASSQVFLQGGSNGTMTTAEYNEKVRTYLKRYSDPEDPLQSYARYPQSDIYDGGFDGPTKREMARFISIRKNTVVHLGTYIEGAEYESVETELSATRTYQGYLADFPESDYFATECFRGTLTPGSYRLSNSRYRDRVSLVYARAMKRSAYMGSSDGDWKNGLNYDGYPGHLISDGYDVKPEFVSKTGVLSAWDKGAVFVSNYDLSSWYFPCFRTVYNNDTSILNSDQVASAIAYVNTVVSAVHRMFQGTEDKTPDELSKLYNDEISLRLKGRFDGKYKITPQAGFTSLDQLRGYSITVPVLFEGNVMPTVMTTYVVATRASGS